MYSSNHYVLVTETIFVYRNNPIVILTLKDDDQLL